VLVYGDIDLVAATGRGLRGAAIWSRPRAGGIVVLAGAVIVFTGAGLLEYARQEGSGSGAQNAAFPGVAGAFVLSLLPVLCGLGLLRTRRTAWPGVVAILIGALTFWGQLLLATLIALLANGIADGGTYAEPAAGFWVSLAGCIPIVLGGAAHAVRASSAGPPTWTPAASR
jgi:hypothetical protein